MYAGSLQQHVGAMDSALDARHKDTACMLGVVCRHEPDAARVLSTGAVPGQASMSLHVGTAGLQMLSREDQAQNMPGHVTSYMALQTASPSVMCL